MNKIICLLICNALTIQIALSAKETITTTGEDYCPFTCNPKTENGKEGFSVEIVRAIFEKAGYKYVHNLMNWARGKKMAATGKSTGAMAGISGELIEDGLIVHKNSIGAFPACYYAAPGSKWKYDGLESIKKITYAWASDWSWDGGEIDAYLNSKGAKAVVISGENVISRWADLLLKGRAEVMGEVQAVIDYTLKPEILKQLTPAGCYPASFEDDAFFIGFGNNEKSKKLIKILDDGIDEMRKSGEIAKILAKYNLKDWYPTYSKLRKEEAAAKAKEAAAKAKEAAAKAKAKEAKK